ncbi:hypothetical protein HDK64DRAFT_7797 [Phyllosticta capitalensis]
MASGLLRTPCASCGHLNCATCDNGSEQDWRCCQCGDRHRTSNRLPWETSEALAQKDLQSLESSIHTLSQLRLAPAYGWIRELLDLNISPKQAAQLLLEQETDYPWIYFEPPQIHCSELKEDCHIPSCPHMRLDGENAMVSSSHQENSASTSLDSTHEQERIRRVIEGLCGIGGVVPSPRLKNDWAKDAIFDPDHHLLKISYGEYGHTGHDSAGPETHVLKDDVLGLAKALDNLYCAASSLQTHQLGCTSFSIIVHPPQSSHAEMVQIPFSRIADLRAALLGDWRSKEMSTGPAGSCLRCRPGECDGQKPCMRCIIIYGKCFYNERGPAMSSSRITYASFPIRGTGSRISKIIRSVGFTARELLSQLGFPTEFVFDENDQTQLSADFSAACLATQVLASGLLSYIQGHLGPLRPFFLDREIQRVLLVGAQAPGAPKVLVRPVEMACLHQMFQKHMLVFEVWQSINGDLAAMPQLRLSATAEDLLDVWGPGCFITKDGDSYKDRQSLLGIRICGGTIIELTEQSGLYHFFPNTTILPDESSRGFRQDERIMIGGPVSTKESCDGNSRMLEYQLHYMSNFLGTHPGGWKLAEVHVGAQAGQYFTAQNTYNFKRTPNSTIKKFQLSKENPITAPFLEHFWGLQISFCTGIAKRVRIRELLADTIPAYLNIQLIKPPVWQELERDNVIEVLRGDMDFQEWFSRRPQEQQIFLERVMRCVLELLQHTGIDDVERTKALSVALILPGQEFHCSRIPCIGDNFWTKILTDSEDCATFAYFTSKCLETEHHRCGIHQSAWEGKTYALGTAVYPCPISIGDVCFSQTPFEFKVKDGFYIGDLKDRLQVRVQRISPRGIELHVSHFKFGEQLFLRLISKGYIFKLHERKDRKPPAQAALILKSAYAG